LDNFEKFCSEFSPEKSIWDNETVKKLIVPGKWELPDNIHYHFIKNILNKLENKDHIPNIIKSFCEYVIEMTGGPYNDSYSRTIFYKAFHGFIKNPVNELKYFIKEDSPEFLSDFSKLSIEDKKTFFLLIAPSGIALRMQSLFQDKDLINSFSSEEILSLVKHLSFSLDKNNLNFFKEFCDEKIMNKIADNNIGNIETMFRFMSNSLMELGQKSGSELFSYFLNNMNIIEENRENLIKYCKDYVQKNKQIDLLITNNQNIETDLEGDESKGELFYYANKLLKNTEEEVTISESIQTDPINNKTLFLKFILEQCSAKLEKENNVKNSDNKNVKVGIKTSILDNLYAEFQKYSNNLSIQTDEVFHQVNFEESYKKIIGKVTSEE
jgi:hypothetical protein